MVVNGISVMRRKIDASLNATQILKVAGVDKSKRTRVLEREILTGEHEKVQGGYGKYQGTWISYERGLELCQKYGVLGLLDPLLMFHESGNTPSKEQAAARQRQQRASMIQNLSQVSASSQALQSIQDPPTRASSQLLGPPMNDFSDDHEQQQQQQQEQYNNNPANLPPIPHELPPSPLTQHMSLTASKAIASLEDHVPAYPPPNASLSEYKEHLQVTGPLDTSLIPDSDEALPSISPKTCDNYDASHDMVMDIFTSKSMEIPASLDPLSVTFDVPIDDMGNTALHWASALGNTSLVKDLISKGANVCRGNFAGETPLIRSVLTTNNSDNSRFADLLEHLYPSIVVHDCSQRNVLHHIALTSDIRGRAGSSSYYMATLLEWLVRRGKGRLEFRKFVADIVNARDCNGDTALGIASKASSSHIAIQLLDIGADENIPNRAGLRPADFGYKRRAENNESQTALPENSSTITNNDATDGLPRPTAPETDVHATQRQKLMEHTSTLLHDAESEFQSQVALKADAIRVMAQDLRDAHYKLRTNRDKLHQINQLQSKQVEVRRSIQNLDRAIADEDTRFRSTTNEAYDDAVGILDADEPFKPYKHRQPIAVMRARIAAYKQNAENLRRLTTMLKERSTSQELKFRSVVSQCTGVAEDRVEELLPALLQAIESDPPEVDMTRISTFLRKIDH